MATARAPHNPARRDAEMAPGIGDQERDRRQLTLTLDVPNALVEELCERLADLLADHARTAPSSPWLTLPAAATYLGCSRDRLYKLTAARAIPFRRKQGGQGILFHRDDLDDWVETAYQPAGCAV